MQIKPTYTPPLPPPPPNKKEKKNELTDLLTVKYLAN